MASAGDMDELAVESRHLDAEQMESTYQWWERKRERDAERHIDVRCPKCGAQERTRCLENGKRIEVSHAERAWKTRPCPACGAAAGKWCKVGPIDVRKVHASRVTPR